ncbi:hypothetical protein ACFWJU_30850 [Streptomyces mutabilis]|uniref:hypothetical protein n=1 Tax=Streptomyces mutabilis TaxID=67332 RepID=UPI003659E60F
MTTPGQEGDPFADAMREAVGTSVEAWRLMMAVADAVRRYQQRKKDREADLPPAEEAVNEVASTVRTLVPPDISAALMGGADWPRMAQQMAALRRAGVDLDGILPRMAEVAVTVRDSVAENAARVSREGTGEWERLLRETLPAGPVREAILSSPTWPDIAATMARLDERGVDVRGILASAHNEGVGVDRAVARVLGANAAPAASRDAMLSYGPLTTSLDAPKDLDLSDRARALRQLAISPAENERYGRWVQEAMPGREQEAGLLLAARQWPLVAARMAKMESEGKPVREHLTRLMKDTSWEQGASSQLGVRLVVAANEALRRVPWEGAGSGSRVNAAAARSRSTSMDPTERRAVAKGAAPAEALVAPHRPESAPASNRKKTR